MDANITVKDNKLIVTGTLSFATVPKLEKVGYNLITEFAEPVFDLQKATVVDNSGLALLIEWVKFAQQKCGKQIKIINMPNQLLDMAKISGLEHILPIK